jgi:RNA polymerase sigma-70 factor (ECF subfamily)
VGAWLLTIARNAALDQARARRRRLDQPGPEPIDAIDNLVGAAGIDSPYEEQSIFADVLRSLPSEQRAVLVAATYQGFTSREIAEAWGLPIGTVKTRLRLALQKLRDATIRVAP